MISTTIRGLVLMGLFAATSMSARADEPLRFRFAPGQTLAYKIDQETRVEETSLDDKTKKPTSSNVLMRAIVTRQWKIMAVDAAGIATVEMSILTLRTERKVGEDAADVFDSTKPDKDDPTHTEMLKNIGKTLAVLRVDARGQVVAVVESKVGSASRFQNELPFRMILPETGPTVGQTWNRAWTIRIDPPQGTGETHDLTQKFTGKEPANGFQVVGIETAAKKMPEIAAERIPLFPLLVTGDVYFHTKTGLYTGARLKMKHSVEGHEGEGSKMTYTGVWSEDYLPPAK